MGAPGRSCAHLGEVEPNSHAPRTTSDIRSHFCYDYVQWQLHNCGKVVSDAMWEHNRAGAIADLSNHICTLSICIWATVSRCLCATCESVVDVLDVCAGAFSSEPLTNNSSLNRKRPGAHKQVHKMATNIVLVRSTYEFGST